MLNSKPDYYNDLDKIYLKIWSLLSDGLADRNAQFHIPVFICGSKKEFDGRIIVLRGINDIKKTLWFHSDIRSKKIETLKNNPQASFLFYDKKEKIQIRAIGNTKVHYKDSFTKSSWKKTAHMSRQCYLGKKSPGSSANNPTSGLSEDIDNSKYSMSESELGYNNFCVVETFLTSIEWLYLASKGHRRAKFLLLNDQVDKKWLIP